MLRYTTLFVLRLFCWYLPISDPLDKSSYGLIVPVLLLLYFSLRRLVCLHRLVCLSWNLIWSFYLETLGLVLSNLLKLLLICFVSCFSYVKVTEIIGITLLAHRRHSLTVDHKYFLSGFSCVHCTRFNLVWEYLWKIFCFSDKQVFSSCYVIHQFN